MTALLWPPAWGRVWVFGAGFLEAGGQPQEVLGQCPQVLTAGDAAWCVSSTWEKD